MRTTARTIKRIYQDRKEHMYCFPAEISVQGADIYAINLQMKLACEVNYLPTLDMAFLNIVVHGDRC